MNAHQLRHNADMLADRATELRKMADIIEGMPVPMGNYVLTIAAALQKHRLCVISAAVLETAKQSLQVYVPEETDHPYEASDKVLAALDAIDQSLSPPPPIADPVQAVRPVEQAAAPPATSQDDTFQLASMLYGIMYGIHSLGVNMSGKRGGDFTWSAITKGIKKFATNDAEPPA